MGNKLSLRSIFFIMTLTAIVLLVVRLAMVTQGENAMPALAVMLLIPLVTFALFGFAFLMLLPFGIIAAMSRESTMPGTSPFAQDRLPEKLIDAHDPQRAN